MDGKELVAAQTDMASRETTVNKKDQKQFRQFLVRRKKHLEVLFTNGLNQWSETVPNSEIRAPHYI